MEFFSWLCVENGFYFNFFSYDFDFEMKVLSIGFNLSEMKTSFCIREKNVKTMRLIKFRRIIVGTF